MALCPASECVRMVRRGNKMVAVVGTQGAVVRPAYEEVMAAVPPTPMRTIYFERFDRARNVWLEDKSFRRDCHNDLEKAKRRCLASPHIWQVVIREFYGEELTREYVIKFDKAEAHAHQLPVDVTFARKAKKVKAGGKTRAY